MSRAFRLKLKQRWLPRLYALLAKGVFRALSSTCRFHVHGLDAYLTLAGRQRCILMLWHNRLTMVAEILRRCAPDFIYSAFISRSRDGEVIAVLTESYSNGRAIRVPHNARGAALQMLIKELKNGIGVVVITPDGPRGPQYHVKPGIVLAAKKTGTAIMPITWDASRVWRLPTWDGLMLPKPFSKISVYFGNPVLLKEGGNIEEDAQKLQEALFKMDIMDGNGRKWT